LGSAQVGVILNWSELRITWGDGLELKIQSQQFLKEVSHGRGSERTYIHCEDLGWIEQGFNKVMEQEGFCRISVLTHLGNTLNLVHIRLHLRVLC
jgi:hypothetical protein